MQKKTSMTILAKRKLKYLFLSILWLTLLLPDTVIGQEHTKPLDTLINCLNFPDSLQGQKILYINNCDIMPQFKGGDEARIKYLSENLKYPIALVPDTITTLKFFLSFIIDTNGKVNNVCLFFKAYKESYTDIEKEGIRVIENMPDWIPGIKNGRKIPVKIIMPFQLNLN
jgi:periplasmic protein TonB